MKGDLTAKEFLLLFDILYRGQTGQSLGKEEQGSSGTGEGWLVPEHPFSEEPSDSFSAGPASLAEVAAPHFFSCLSDFF